MRLRHKVAVVTGAGSGIGKETALLFAREGARVVVSDMNETTGNVTLAEIRSSGGEGIFVKADVVGENDVQYLMKETYDYYKKLNVLVNSAGIAEACSIAELGEDGWNRIIDVNLKGVFLCCKHVIPYMKISGSGSIVNLASIAAHVAIPRLTAYCASKGGVVMLSKAIALDYAKDNIRINTVCPAFIRTPLTTEGPVKDSLDYIGSLHPLGRLGEPIEVAYAVLFLASDESSFTTGSCLMVDGGYTVQ